LVRVGIEVEVMGVVVDGTAFSITLAAVVWAVVGGEAG